MNRRITLLSTASAVAAGILLTACSTGTTSSAAATRPSASTHAGPSASAPPPPPTPSLSVRASALGSILVDTAGQTIYVFTADRPGMPACSATCLAAWPIVPAGAMPEDPPGSTAQLGEFTRPDGSRQLTVDGAPAYTFTSDSAPGATSGEGVRVGTGTFLVVAPSGGPIDPAPTAPPAPPPVATRPAPPKPAPPPMMTPLPTRPRTPSDGDGDNRGGADDGDDRV